MCIHTPANFTLLGELPVLHSVFPQAIHYIFFFFLLMTPFPQSSTQHNIKSHSDSSPCLSSHLLLFWFFNSTCEDPSDHTGSTWIMPHLDILHLLTLAEFLLPCKWAHSQVLGIWTVHLWTGHPSASHTLKGNKQDSELCESSHLKGKKE